MDAVDDQAWTDRCLSKMLELDPKLDPDLARPIAADMCTRTRWRSMEPEAAAQLVFDYDAGKR
jgi:hypothetical protein